jgi:hypothetical protein
MTRHRAKAMPNYSQSRFNPNYKQNLTPAINSGDFSGLALGG